MLCPCRPVPGALAGALRGVEDHLAYPDHIWRHLDALIGGAEFQSLLQPEDPRPGKPLEFLTGGRAHIGQLAFPAHVDVEVLGSGILADHHPGVDSRAGLYKEGSPISPRDGTVKSSRTQPSPDTAPSCSSRPLRPANSSVTAPTYSSGTSIVSN